MNKLGPTLSVVVPVKNGAATLAELLISLRQLRIEAESHGHAIQVVVQDGGSTDDTMKIAEEYLSGSDVLASEIDAGIYDAMNRAIRRARGEWLIFVGADDRFLCKSICEKLEGHSSAAQVLIGESITSSGRLMRNRWGWRMLFAHSVNHQACVYHNEIFRKYEYPTAYKLAADYWLNLRLYLDRVHVRKLPNLLLVEFGDNGVSSRQKDLGYREVCRAKRELLGVWGRASNLAVALRRSIYAFGR